MLEVDSTRWELVNSIVFALVDAGLIEYTTTSDYVDKAHDVVLKALEDVRSFEVIKRIVITN